MKTAQIKEWLNYWNNSKCVAVNQIKSLSDVHEARKFCSVMRKGLFNRYVVSDEQIWDAVKETRLAA